MTDPLRIFAVTVVACATTAARDPQRATAWVQRLAAPCTLAVMRNAGFRPAPVQSL